MSQHWPGMRFEPNLLDQPWSLRVNGKCAKCARAVRRKGIYRAEWQTDRGLEKYIVTIDKYPLTGWGLQVRNGLNLAE